MNSLNDIDTLTGSAGFADVISEYDWDETTRTVASATEQDVIRVLEKAEAGIQPLTPEEFGVLISPAAVPFLDRMALLSRKYTLERFGKTISLYIPMYVSNACANACIYCGFNHNNPFETGTDRGGMPCDKTARRFR